MPYTILKTETNQPVEAAGTASGLLRVETTPAEPPPTFGAVPDSGTELEAVYVAGSITEAPVTQSSPGFLVQSLLVSPTPGRLVGVFAANFEAAEDMWIGIYNKISVPSLGEQAGLILAHTRILVPRLSAGRPGDRYFVPAAPIRLTAGCAIVLESAPNDVLVSPTTGNGAIAAQFVADA